MQIFRIAKTRSIRDLSGTGALLYGGRWNPKGTPVIYASENRALAALEFLVHVPLPLLPNHLSIACLEISDDVGVEEIGVGDLPKNWRETPAPPALAGLGKQWAIGMRALLLRVPSVVIAGEFNVLINPKHPDIGKVVILNVEGYHFDKRLVQKRGENVSSEKRIGQKDSSEGGRR